VDPAATITEEGLTESFVGTEGGGEVEGDSEWGNPLVHPTSPGRISQSARIVRRRVTASPSAARLRRKVSAETCRREPVARSRRTAAPATRQTKSASDTFGASKNAPGAKRPDAWAHKLQIGSAARRCGMAIALHAEMSGRGERYLSNSSNGRQTARERGTQPGPSNETKLPGTIPIALQPASGTFQCISIANPRG
jgi:hypothetical protein